MRKPFLYLTIAAAMIQLSACKNAGTSSDNPLLQESSLPFGAPDFSKIQVTDYLPALEAAIEQARDEVNLIADNEEAPTFDNTILAFDESGKTLDRVSSLL